MAFLHLLSHTKKNRKLFDSPRLSFLDSGDRLGIVFFGLVSSFTSSRHRRRTRMGPRLASSPATQRGLIAVDGGERCEC